MSVELVSAAPLSKEVGLGARRRRTEEADALLGARLRDIRQLRSMSLQELARRSGVTFQQIQKYERGTNRVAATMLLRIATALDVAPELLLTGLSGAARTDESVSSSERLMLVESYSDLSPGFRRAVLAFMLALGNEEFSHGPGRPGRSNGRAASVQVACGRAGLAFSVGPRRKHSRENAA
jgi:transcriptional regulator with XRE-family HTH domain